MISLRALVCILVVSFAFVGCNIIDNLGGARYTIVCMENYSDRPVVMRFYEPMIEDQSTLHLAELPACTARRWRQSGPPGGLDPVALDAEGKRVDATVRMRRVGERSAYHVQVHARDPRECPLPVEDRFLLRVENRTWNKLPIIYKGQTVGASSPKEVAEFGPLDGHWCDFAGLDLPAPDMQNRVESTGILMQSDRIEFELGQVPIISVYVRDTGWP
jgi:hypothetical protein